MEPAVVYGYWPCYSEGDDLVVLDAETHSDEVARFTFPRQHRDRFLCLADFFRPKDSGRARRRRVPSGHDGPAASARSPASCSQPTPTATTSSCTGSRVQLTEALAEYWHARVRDELGLRRRGPRRPRAVFRQGYRGLAYSFGYPACPDLEDRAELVRAAAPERIGVTSSEELQLHPEQSTDALVVHHPEAKYFNAR